jgi:oligosaccharyltransferase complex subunit beta
MMCSNYEIARTATKGIPSSSPNHVFCEELIQWNFGASGVIKAENIIHKQVNSTEINPTEYGIKTMIEYQVDLFEWDRKTGKWVSFNNADAQLEFQMLDPFYRVSLVQVGQGKPTYKASFMTPDRLGVFQFKVNYTRKGYTYLDLATRVQ